MPKKKFIQVPLDLARLLVAEPDDFKDESKYESAQETAKALLKLLVAMEK